MYSSGGSRFCLQLCDVTQPRGPLQGAKQNVFRTLMVFPSPITRRGVDKGGSVWGSIEHVFSQIYSDFQVNRHDYDPPSLKSFNVDISRILLGLGTFLHVSHCGSWLLYFHFYSVEVLGQLKMFSDDQISTTRCPNIKWFFKNFVCPILSNLKKLRAAILFVCSSYFSVWY